MTKLYKETHSFENVNHLIYFDSSFYRLRDIYIYNLFFSPLIDTTDENSSRNIEIMIIVEHKVDNSDTYYCLITDVQDHKIKYAVFSRNDLNLDQAKVIALLYASKIVSINNIHYNLVDSFIIMNLLFIHESISSTDDLLKVHPELAFTIDVELMGIQLEEQINQERVSYIKQLYEEGENAEPLPLFITSDCHVKPRKKRNEEDDDPDYNPEDERKSSNNKKKMRV